MKNWINNIVVFKYKQHVDMQFNESQIEELFSQKTSRAVDRVFTENKLDGIHSLFVSLQEVFEMVSRQKN